jgi:dUTP pyrophosphatase
MNGLNDLANEELKQYSKQIQDYLKQAEEEQEINFDKIYQEYGVDIKKLEDDMKNYHPKLTLGYNILHDNAIPPKYNYMSDSGFDLYSIEDVTIQPLGRALVRTGLSFNIKDGYEIQVRSKSGLAINQGLMCLNSPGTVDNGYTGEVKVILFNTNQSPVNIIKGMKIAQAVLCPVVNGKWVDLEQSNKKVEKDRGENGFGSTGIGI